MIQVQELTKSFTSRKRRPGFMGSVVSLFSAQKETITAVDHVNFDIGQGELVGYLGPNGAGKSTTIKMLTGILVPTSGRVLVDGIDPEKDRRAVARKIGVVFGQKTQLWWDLPVEESFDLLRAVYRIPGAE
ncbi:MAG TPA: ATP-binding cassette domain-containing protein, partial [Leptospiraceae bacterium]|nr:ATP-binding cassette domain-containing protein [Leptospiraceae bacterium]